MLNKKLKILYLHANNNDVGGADFCLFKLADELDKEMFEPIVALSKKTEIYDLYINAGIKTVIIGMERIKKSKNPLYYFKLLLNFPITLFKISKLIKSENIDIIHGNDLLDIYGPIVGKISNIKSIQYIRWILVSPIWLKKIITTLVHFLNNKIFTVSDGVANEMFKNYLNSKNDNKIVTCYDWIDMEKVGHHSTLSKYEFHNEFHIPQNNNVVGLVGRLEPWKGQDIFIKAADKVLQKFPNTTFLIVGGEVLGGGRENYKLELLNLAKECGVTSNLIFTGQRKDIFALMSNFDICVHASTTPDPLPGVVMEAQYCKKPIVGANAGGVPEELINGKTGYLYKMGNYFDMADKIIQLLSDKDLQIKFGEAGYKNILTKFNKNDLCRKIEIEYKNLLNN